MAVKRALIVDDSKSARVFLSRILEKYGKIDVLPSDASLWSWFLHHPAVSPLLPETQYPTLYGEFAPGTERPAPRDILRRGAIFPTCHCLLPPAFHIRWPLRQNAGMEPR